MEELEANYLIPRPPLLENHGDKHSILLDNVLANAKQQPKHGKPKAPNYYPPKFDELCSVKFLSVDHEDPKLEAEITEMKELVNKLSRDKLAITKKLDERMFDRRDIVQALVKLNYHKRRLRRDMEQIWEEKDIFVTFLDKQNLANNSSLEEIPVKSCLSREEVVQHKLRFRVLHGTTSLVKEMHLFREIKAEGQQCCKDVNSCLSLEELTCSYYRKIRCEKTHRKATKDRLGEIISWPRKENAAEAIVLGKIRKSLSANRKSIREQVKVLSNELVELRKKQLRVGPKVGRLKGELKMAEKEIKLFRNQLADTSERKKKVYQCFLQLMKKPNYI